MLYEYVLLLTCSFLAYKGAGAGAFVIIIGTAMLLSLPRVIKDQQAGTLSLTTAVSAANSLLFAAMSFGAGRLVSWLLAPI
jgi:hypothetical protein